MLLRGTAPDEWTYVDRVLMIAHVLAGDMLCTGCGQPKHESYNPDSEGWYDVRDATCQGCAAVEQDSKAHKDHDHARKVWVVDDRPADVELKPWSP